MINNLSSRRSILIRAVAGTAATAIPVAASSLVGGQPDDELLALGRECDALYARYFELRTAMAPHWEEYHRRRELLKAAERRGELDSATFTDQLMRIMEDCGIANDGLDDLTDAMDAPHRRIMAVSVHTVEGLAIKARAAAFSCEHFWDVSFADADWDRKHVRSLVEAVLMLAGQPLPFPAK
jgi:hypothetical protein